jgi:hypothetical protein
MAFEQSPKQNCESAHAEHQVDDAFVDFVLGSLDPDMDALETDLSQVDTQKILEDIGIGEGMNDPTEAPIKKEAPENDSLENYMQDKHDLNQPPDLMKKSSQDNNTSKGLRFGSQNPPLFEEATPKCFHPMLTSFSLLPDDLNLPDMTFAGRRRSQSMPPEDELVARRQGMSSKRVVNDSKVPLSRLALKMATKYPRPHHIEATNSNYGGSMADVNHSHANMQSLLDGTIAAQHQMYNLQHFHMDIQAQNQTNGIHSSPSGIASRYWGSEASAFIATPSPVLPFIHRGTDAEYQASPPRLVPYTPNSVDRGHKRGRSSDIDSRPTSAKRPLSQADSLRVPTGHQHERTSSPAISLAIVRSLVWEWAEKAMASVDAAKEDIRRDAMYMGMSRELETYVYQWHCGWSNDA